MKKAALMLIIAVFASVAAFADHRPGWGVGVVGQGGVVWDGFGGAGGGSLSLKMPQIPVYWGINLAIRRGILGVSVTGDCLLIDDILVREFNLGWFLGLGAYAGIYAYSGSETGISARAGARAPIGLCIFPLSFLEFFFGLAPSLGMEVGIGDRLGISFPDGGIGAELGVRFWL